MSNLYILSTDVHPVTNYMHFKNVTWWCMNMSSAHSLDIRFDQFNTLLRQTYKSTAAYQRNSPLFDIRLCRTFLFPFSIRHTQYFNRYYWCMILLYIQKIKKFLIHRTVLQSLKDLVQNIHAASTVDPLGSMISRTESACMQWWWKQSY